MDPADYPYRVLNDDRLHALLIGPAVSGKTALGLHLARQGRKVLTVATRHQVWKRCGKLGKGSRTEWATSNKTNMFGGGACGFCKNSPFFGKGSVFQTNISPWNIWNSIPSRVRNTLEYVTCIPFYPFGTPRWRSVTFGKHGRSVSLGQISTESERF